MRRADNETPNHSKLRVIQIKIKIRDRSDHEDMILGGAPPIKPAEFKVSGRLADGTHFIGYSDRIKFTGLE